MKDKKSKEPLTHSNIPATVGLVHEVRKELKAEIRGVGRKVDSLESKIDSLEGKIGSFEKRMISFEARMESKHSETMSVAHGTKILIEEQRAENRIVLDGLQTFMERHDRIEAHLGNLKNSFESLKPRGA